MTFGHTVIFINTSSYDMSDLVQKIFCHADIMCQEGIFECKDVKPFLAPYKSVAQTISLV